MMPVAERFMTRVRRNEPMSRHTSWHVGGAAEIYFSPRDRAELRAFLHSVPEGTPIQFVGLGSNLLVRDGGIRGVVVATQEALLRLERVDESTVYGEAGVPCARERTARQIARPSAPVIGASPAEYTSVTSSTSAWESTRPKSSMRSRVRV